MTSLTHFFFGFGHLRKAANNSTIERQNHGEQINKNAENARLLSAPLLPTSIPFASHTENTIANNPRAANIIGITLGFSNPKTFLTRAPSFHHPTRTIGTIQILTKTTKSVLIARSQLKSAMVIDRSYAKLKREPLSGPSWARAGSSGRPRSSRSQACLRRLPSAQRP